MLCEEPPANGCNFAAGEVIHIAYLGDLSVYHVRLKSRQMISAQLQTPIVIVKGYRPGRRSAFVLGSGQLCGADGLRSKDEYT